MTFPNIFDGPNDDRELSLREQIRQARPGQQIEILRPHVEKFWRPGRNHLLDHLLQAEGILSRLLGSSAELAHRYRAEFDAVTEKLVAEIEAAELAPLVERGTKFAPGGKLGRKTRIVQDRQAVMLDAIRDFEKSYHRIPTAAELWDRLQHRHEFSGVAYPTFQNDLTQVRKNLK